MDDLTAATLTDLRATVQRLSDELTLAREAIGIAREELWRAERTTDFIIVSSYFSAIQAYDEFVYENQDQTP